MENKRFDGMLMEILEDRKTIAGFLDAIFGFLSRNTDFYYEQKDKDDKVGFPTGVKENIVLKVLQRFDPKYRYVADNSDVPPAIEEVEIVSENEESKTESETDKCEETTTTKTTTPRESNKEFFSTNEFHNGACFDSYCWSQTSTEVEVHIRLPVDASSSKQLNIKILADTIEVSSKVNPSAALIFNGTLSAKCRHNDSLWTISEGKLNITLDKMKEAWWDRLIDGEPSIDVKKIDCSKYLDELPLDSQANIEKLCRQQQQKQSAEVPSQVMNENVDRLRAAWNAEGSPFKGQPFDPSIVKFN